MRLGVLGGTFDPPHFGHLGVVGAALASGLVDRVLIVPCFSHALGKAPAPYEHRLAMCRVLVADEPLAEVSDAERSLSTPGRTLELLRILGERHPGDELRLLAGADIYHERDKWHRFDDVARLAPPLYVARRGVSPIPEPTLPPPPEVSSKEVRGRLAAGEHLFDLVPDRVLEYIAAHSLYREAR